MAKPGQRHPLLIYKQLFGTWRNAAFLIFLASAALAYFQPPPFNTDDILFTAVIALTIMGGLLFIYTLIAPRLAFVQCHSNVLRVNVPPFFSLAISYKRIRTLRPYKFVPQVPGGQRHLVEPYMGQTAVALELSSYPIAERMLRFWLHPTMFSKDFKGLVLLTADWMKLSHEIDSYSSDWKGRKRSKTTNYTSAGSSMLNRR